MSEELKKKLKPQGLKRQTKGGKDCRKGKYTKSTGYKG